MMISELRWKLRGSQTSLYDTLRLLIEAGIVKETIKGNWPRRRLFELTPLGEKVAEKIAEIEALLKNAEGGE